MKKIEYNSTYIPTRIVEDCFNKTKNFQFVDKVLTGNGFTTSYLKIKPTHFNQSNIIIVPNKGVIKSKQQKHIHTLKYGTEEEKRDLPSIGFFYGDDASDTFQFNKFDIMMFVVDSFLHYKDVIVENKILIDKILIDEAHSVIIQSTFRKNLVDFIDIIKSDFEDKKIVCVTATPMLFNEVDIRIYPKEVKKRDIHISSNQESSLERLKTLLKDKKKCIVALQDVRLLKQLANSKGVLKANIKVGSTLFLKLVEAVNLEVDEDSNLTIISSAGFEGFDVENGINNFFLFEDRAFDYQTFYAQNLIQAIGRSRQGTEYIEWCRMPNMTRTPMQSKEAMIKIANSKKISNEKKLTSKNYTFIPKYFDYNQDVKLGLILDFKLNETKYHLDYELSQADLRGVNKIYEAFFKERGFSLIYLNEGHKRLNLKNVSHKVAFRNLKLNEDIIIKNSLLRGLRLNTYKKDKLDYYVKEYEVFLRRKYYFLDELPFSEGFVLRTCAKKENLNNIEKELFAYSILKDESSINEACHLICKNSIEKKKEEINRNGNEFKEWKKDLIENIKDRYIRLIMAFSQEKIRVPKKIRNSRDYNLTTEVSMMLIKAVSDLFDIDVYEFDIRSCNSRIIYSMVGLPLPSNFYGENKKNKKKINTILNILSSEYAEKKNIKVSKHKENIIRNLRNLGFDEKVISFLISTFWNKPMDAIFNFCAYHEKQIIESLTNELDIYTNKGMIRRHDSVLYFGEINEMQFNIIENFKYKGTNGWFYNDVNIDEIITEKAVVNVPLKRAI